MSDYAQFHDTVVAALQQIRDNNFSIDDAVIYVHPETHHIMRKDMPFDMGIQSVGEEFHGHKILQTRELPKEVIMVTVPEYVQRGQDAIAFGTVQFGGSDE